MPVSPVKSKRLLKLASGTTLENLTAPLAVPEQSPGRFRSSIDQTPPALRRSASIAALFSSAAGKGRGRKINKSDRPFNLQETRYNQLYERIVSLFKESVKEEPKYSEMIQKGMVGINYQKNDKQKILILHKDRRLELPKHVKDKFTSRTNRKFMVQNAQRKNSMSESKL